MGSLAALALWGAGLGPVPMAEAAATKPAEKPACGWPNWPLPSLKAKSTDCELAEQGDANAAYRLATPLPVRQGAL